MLPRRPLRDSIPLFILILSLTSSFNLRIPQVQSASYPDLVPGTIHNNTLTGNETKVCSGVAITFKTNVTNIGPSTSGNFSVEWYVRNSANVTVAGPSPGIPLILGPLESQRNATTNFTWPLTPTPTGAPASFIVGIFVNPTNTTNEGPGGRNNNSVERSFLVFNWDECSTSFFINPLRNTVHIVPGEMAAFTLLVILTHGVPQQLALRIPDNQTLKSQLRLGNLTFSPPSVLVNKSIVATSILVIQTMASTPPKDVPYEISVIGTTSTNVQSKTTIWLDVSTPVSIAGVVVAAGGSKYALLRVRVHGNVTLTYTVENLDSTTAQSKFGLRITFDPNPVALDPSDKETVVNLTISAGQFTDPRPYGVKIFAKGNQTTGSGTFNLQVTIPRDFVVTLNPDPCVVPNLQDPSIQYCQVTVTVLSGGNYNGTVRLGIDLLGSGLTSLLVCPTSMITAECRPYNETDVHFLVASINGTAIATLPVVLFLFFNAEPDTYKIDINSTGRDSLHPPGPVEFTIVVWREVAVPVSFAQLIFAYIPVAVITLILGRRSGRTKSRQGALDH